MEKEAQPTLYDRKLQKELKELEDQLERLLQDFSPAHADKAVEVLIRLKRLRKDMHFT